MIGYCKVCERNGVKLAAAATTGDGVEITLCVDCVRHIQELPSPEETGEECAHFHEGDGKEIASDVERFFKR